MDKAVKAIINSHLSEEAKLKALEWLSDDIELGKKVVEGMFEWCPVCDDYYYTHSFFTETMTEDTRICVYRDPINSGGNDYVDGSADIIYRVCPKGHRVEIDRTERRK